jgi:phospholipid/cholesterol/gamma-HCH transport system substrate-binding protein
MKERDFLKKFWAGIFFISCIVVIVAVIFVIGLERGFTERKFTMVVLFREIGGLIEGAPVRLSGVTVGTVGRIDFLETEVAGRGVRVQLSLFKKFERQLKKSQNFAIKTEGVLGGKVVEIHAVPDFVRQDLSQPVIGDDPLDVQNIAERFGEAATALKETSHSVNHVSTDIQDVASVLRRMLMRMEERVIEGNLFKVF